MMPADSRFQVRAPCIGPAHATPTLHRANWPHLPANHPPPPDGAGGTSSSGRWGVALRQDGPVRPPGATSRRVRCLLSSGQIPPHETGAAMCCHGKSALIIGRMPPPRGRGAARCSIRCQPPHPQAQGEASAHRPSAAVRCHPRRRQVPPRHHLLFCKPPEPPVFLPSLLRPLPPLHPLRHQSQSHVRSLR